MKKITPIILLIASLLPFTATADLMIDKSANRMMETMTVTYRAPIDYALYQYTTEMLVNFRIQIKADIYQQAHESIMTMANSVPYMSVNTPALKKKMSYAE